MMTQALIATSYLVALVVALVITPMSIRLARSIGVVDLPHARKVHAEPTPRLGGVAIAIAVGLAAVPLLLILAMSERAAEAGQWTGCGMLLTASLMVMLLGLADDIWTLKSKHKLLGLLAAAAAVCATGLRIDEIAIGGDTLVELGWISWPVTILWLVGIAVCVNFIDGLDGLAAGVTAIATGVLAIVITLSSDAATSIVVLALLGSLTGFLFYNFNPARVFMGDSGAMFIGFLLAGACLLATPELGAVRGVFLPALALSVPILDGVWTLLRRKVLQRRSLFSAERGHIHHQLLNLGLGQRHAVLVIYGVSIAAAGLGLLSLMDNRWATMGGLALLLPLLVGLFRGAGSIRVRDTVSAIRRNRALGQGSQRDQRAFEEMQLGFGVAKDFESWWGQVCAAAQSLGFMRVGLTVTNRDGSDSHYVWTPPGLEPQDLVTTDASTSLRLNARVPIRQRRSDAPLEAEVFVPSDPCLESAGRRLALFTRLMEEYNLTTLPDPLAMANASHEPPKNDSDSTHANAAQSNGHRADSGNGQAPGASASPPIPTPHQNELGVIRPNLKVAVVHDFLYTYAGAERVLEQILNLFPEADLFSLFDFLPEGKRGFIKHKQVTTSLIQRLPLAKKKHRAYLPIMPFAIEQLDMSQYDLVVSSSYLAAKGVITRPDTLHVCYCHTPVRYAWDLQHQYLGSSKVSLKPKSLIARLILHYLRSWDARSANGVDVFVSNSDFVGRRIRKAYRRESTTVYPPVDVASFTPGEKRAEFYVTASRLVQYKRIDAIVDAFNQMPERELIVVGDGPDMEKLKAKANKNIRFVGHQSNDRLKVYIQMARAFIFAAEEDFGIVPVEAQACGTPVIAYARGGVTESVIDQQTGLFFEHQTPESIKQAVERFEFADHAWDHDAIRRHAEQYSPNQFRERFARIVVDAWGAFNGPAKPQPYTPAEDDQPSDSAEVESPRESQIGSVS